MRVISFLVCFLFAFMLKAAASADSLSSIANPEASFSVGEPKGCAAVAETLRQKTRSIIGRIGCGAEDAAYVIVPSLVVDETKSTVGTLRNVTVAKGTLTLEAVSAGNPDMVWHSITIPLKASITGPDANPEEALAKQIQVSDSRFVRFVRVARKKIAEASVLSNNEEKSARKPNEILIKK